MISHSSILKTREKIEKEASSKSILKTIREIETIIAGKPLSSRSQLRSKLHAKIYKLLRIKAMNWYRKGFKRGHETVAMQINKVPKTIKREMTMTGFYFGPQGKDILLRSRLKD